MRILCSNSSLCVAKFLNHIKLTSPYQDTSFNFRNIVFFLFLPKGKNTLTIFKVFGSYIKIKYKKIGFNSVREPLIALILIRKHSSTQQKNGLSNICLINEYINSNRKKILRVLSKINYVTVNKTNLYYRSMSWIY